MIKLLKNCRILRQGKLIKTNILIKDSKISRISKKDFKANQFFNLKGKIVLPGIIDPHVHFREPGLTHKEDFLSGSIAAARGGITTILDMPNTIPPTITCKSLEDKRELAKQSIVNYGFHFGAARHNLHEILNAKNIASVKIFMDESTGDMKIHSLKTIEQIMGVARLCTVHAEAWRLHDAIQIAQKVKKKFYACHISHQDELKMVQQNRKFVFSEVTPHHLFLTQQDEKKLGRLAKVKPSLKSMADQKSLWKGINNGLIDTIGTDHAPHLKEEKLYADKYGLPGIETMLPLLLDAVNDRRISLQKLVQLTSLNPAKIFRIRNKGMLKEGFDADLTVVDMDLKQKVSSDRLFSKAQWTPFDGRSLKGWPVMTFVNGNLVHDYGNVIEISAKEVSYHG